MDKLGSQNHKKSHSTMCIDIYNPDYNKDKMITNEKTENKLEKMNQSRKLKSNGN